ncbi:MAG: spondin domain-containing protein, partial [Planctomycetota bacterium]
MVLGTGLPTGENLERSFSAQTPLARITISTAASPSGPIDEEGPRAELVSGDLNAIADSHEIVVRYSDPSGIALSSITTDSLRITGPLLTQLDIASVTTDAAAGETPTEVTATYVISPDSGSFTHVDNGTYSVVLMENTVSDTLSQSATAQTLGTFDVAAPTRLNVTYENLAPDGGLTQTPVWFAAHDGSFEVGRLDGVASDFGGLELIAEEGDISELAARFAAESTGVDSALFAPDGFAGAPVIEPGETASQTLDVFVPADNRYFSFASMVIPSNDAFIANLNGRQYPVFDSLGNFSGPLTITVYGRDIWDAGTEVNDPAGGAAFSTGGGEGVDENGQIRRHEGLDDFIGTGLPTGENLQSAFDDLTPIGRFTIALETMPSGPIDSMAPTATASPADITSPDVTEHQITVTYTDASGVDVTSIDTDDLRIFDGLGRPLNVVSVTTDVAAGQVARTVNATYTIERPDGAALSTRDNGLYFVSVDVGQIADELGNAIETTSLGSFQILLPVQLRITVENLSLENGLYQTPFFASLHDGNFEIARSNQPASNFPGLEALAEEGDASGLLSRFETETNGAAGVVLGPEGFGGAPVLDPGEIGAVDLSVFNTNENRFFSFASMLIPSNDAFVTNLNARSHEVFDSNGNFLGTQTITITGKDVLDAGTEQNAVGAGAPFSTLGGDGVDENGVIRRHAGLNEFIGTELATGENLSSAFTDITPIARITIGLLDGTDQPIDQTGPQASLLTADPVLTPGTDSTTISVQYSDPSGIDLGSIDTSDLIVRGPLGNVLEITQAVVRPTGETAPNSVIVDYTVTTPDGPFTARDNARYIVETASSQVNDTLGLESDGTILGELVVQTGIRLRVEVESLQPDGGTSLTPLWVGFHDGGFEVARSGVAASEFGGLELIAEEGSPQGIVDRFAAESNGVDTVLAAPEGFAGAPVIEPGENSTQIVTIDNSVINRYFSFASMVIPSNDAFVANLDPRAYRLFDNRGNFTGARQFTIFGRDIYDAGTEENNPTGGAAFSTGGGDGVDENGVVHPHTGLQEFVGTGLPTGENLQSVPAANDALFQITISLVDPVADVCSGVDTACSVNSVPLHNSAINEDVNGDGLVSAIDALLIINFLNQHGVSDTISDEAQATGLDLDVGGDTRISAIDALAVINELNRLLRDPDLSGEDVPSDRSAAVDLLFG